MTCREAIAVLADYLAAMLDTRAAGTLEEHLAECDECRAYLATYRQTVRAVSAAAGVEMPEQMRHRLRVFLLERLREPE